MYIQDTNLFVHYNIKMYNNHFKIQKKVARVNYKNCQSITCNQYFPFKLYLKYYVKHAMSSSGAGNCKVKDHCVANDNDMIHDVVDGIE